MTSRARDWRPLYLQVAEELREQIESGELPAGTALPSETDLADRYDMSRTSIRQSIRMLREWGLVRAEQGRGTYVRPARQRITRSPDRYQWEKDRARLPEDERARTGAMEYDTGLEFEALDFRAAYAATKADSDLSDAFAIPLGSELLERTYVTISAKEHAPLSVIHSWIPAELIKSNPALSDVNNEPWPGGTFHQLLTVGIEIDRITDRIIARPPQPSEALELDIDDGGVAILAIRKTSYDTTGRAVEISDVLLPGDRTQLLYTTNLKRWDD